GLQGLVERRALAPAQASPHAGLRLVLDAGLAHDPVPDPVEPHTAADRVRPPDEEGPALDEAQGDALPVAAVVRVVAVVPHDEDLAPPHRPRAHVATVVVAIVDGHVRDVARVLDVEVTVLA